MVCYRIEELSKEYFFLLVKSFSKGSDDRFSKPLGNVGGKADSEAKDFFRYNRDGRGKV